MKWLIFTGACVAVLVTLGILAVDERNVIWEGRTPLCPYCRSELPNQAIVCKECGRSIDWVSHSETCRWCLSRKDVEHMTNLFDRLKVAKGPLPGELREFPQAYFRTMEAGACAYCGGLGKVMVDGKEVTCPVCRGARRCIACGGDRRVELGDPVAARHLRERHAARELAERRAELTGLPLKLTLLVDQDVDALRGYVEAETLTGEQGRNLLEMARARVKRAFRALHAEVARKEKEAVAAPGG